MVKPGYKQTEIGVLPEDWDVLSLGSISHFLDSKRIPIKESERIKMQGDYPYYGASGIIDYVNDYIFDGEYILLGEDGANIIDRSSRLAFVVSGKCWINNHAHVIEPHENMDIHFLAEYLESISYDEYNTGTAQPKLNREKCNMIPIPIPPLCEQKQIAILLKDCDRLIDTLEREVCKKKAIKQGAMQELLTGKKRLPGFSGEWENIALGMVSSFYNGGTPSKKREDWWQGNIPWISSSDLSEGNITSVKINHCISQDAVDHSATRICPKNSVLVVSRVGVGKVAVSPCDLCTSQDFTTVVSSKHNPYFLAYMLIPIMKNLAGQAQGTSIKGVTVEEIQKIVVPTPAIDEQNQIVNTLVDIDSEIMALEEKLEKYRQLKQGMMQQLLTGKIRLV